MVKKSRYIKWMKEKKKYNCPVDKNYNTLTAPPDPLQGVKTSPFPPKMKGMLCTGQAPALCRHWMPSRERERESKESMLLVHLLVVDDDDGDDFIMIFLLTAYSGRQTIQAKGSVERN